MSSFWVIFSAQEVAMLKQHKNINGMCELQKILNVWVLKNFFVELFYCVLKIRLPRGHMVTKIDPS